MAKFKTADDIIKGIDSLDSSELETLLKGMKTKKKKEEKPEEEEEEEEEAPEEEDETEEEKAEKLKKAMSEEEEEEEQPEEEEEETEKAEKKKKKIEKAIDGAPILEEFNKELTNTGAIVKALAANTIKNNDVIAKSMAGLVSIISEMQKDIIAIKESPIRKGIVFGDGKTKERFGKAQKGEEIDADKRTIHPIRDYSALVNEASYAFEKCKDKEIKNVLKSITGNPMFYKLPYKAGELKKAFNYIAKEQDVIISLED